MSLNKVSHHEHIQYKADSETPGSQDISSFLDGVSSVQHSWQRSSRPKRPATIKWSLTLPHVSRAVHLRGFNFRDQLLLPPPL